MIVGIDLGTTNSLIAVFRDSGPELIPNALGSFLTPSAVHMDETKQASVGQSAKDRLMTSPGASAARFKRLMGTNQWTALRKSKFRPEDLSAFVLKALRADAEAFLDEPVEEAVISVPAYFNDVQRNATIAAAKIAGLKVKRLINEPTAAALAYGLHDRDGEDTFLVIDIGGGTFDVSILEMFDGVMEVRACAGDAFLGGEDFTDRIVDDFAAQLAISTADMDPASHARLRSIADQAKHLLGENTVAKLPFVTGNREVTLKISRSHLEDICGDLINRMRLPIQRAISDANLKASEINRIILVGGASRMLLVRTLVTRLFQRFPEHDIDPDHVVALGTAVQAGLSERHKALEEIVMTDVCPFTLGYETARQIGPNKEMEYGVFSPLVERNTTVPVSRSQIVTPLTLGQTLIELNIFQGEAPYVTDNIRIGSLNVSIPRNHNDLEKVDIRFTYDNSGVLEVIAKVLSNNHEKRIIIEGNPGALSSREIEQRLKALEHIKVHPRDELVNEAMLARLSSLYENLLGDQRASVSNLIGQFEGVLARQDKREIEQTRKSILTHVVQLEQGHKFD